MNRTLITSFALSVLTAGSGLSQGTVDPTEIRTVHDLVAKIKERERAVESVALEMRTTSKPPGEAGIETAGTLRVLGTTHFHTSMRVEFGDGMTSEFETVKTPEGVVMRESDPAQGEVFVKMGPELLADLESASKALGEGGAVVGGGDMANGPLGSVMLEDLDAQFDLSLAGPRDIDGRACWTASGPRRADLSDEEAVFGPVDHVDLVVRRDDLAVVRMTQLAGGRPFVTVEITGLEIDEPMDPESFEIEVPAGARVVDALDHPPARAQIERIFAEAEAKGWTRETKSGTEERESTGR